MEQLLQGLLIIAALGLIFLLLYQVAKALGGLFVIGLMGSLVFMEIYGIYFFFTEHNLYVEDLSSNGIWSFTGFYIAFNICVICLAITKGIERFRA